MANRRLVALMTALVMLLTFVSLPVAANSRYEERPVKLTEGPGQIVRGFDAMKMSDDSVLYSRTGIRLVKDNASGLMLERWDNGTFVYDISDDRQYSVSPDVLEADISGNLLVWREGLNIMVLNYFNGTRTVLPLKGAIPVYRPEIEGDRIVWADVRNDPDPGARHQHADIYLYNMTTMEETRLTQASNISRKGQPDLRGDLVVWNDDRNGDFDIYAYVLSNGTEMRVTNDTGGQFLPRASSRAIAWVDDRFAEDPDSLDIFYYDLATGREGRASTSGAVGSFDIWGERIVWTDNSRPGSPGQEGDILVHSMTENRTKVYYASNFSQYGPVIWGSRVVWVDCSSPGGELYMMRKLDRPLFGIDMTTLVLVPMATIAATIGLATFKYRVAKEEKEIEAYEQKARKRKRGKGLKNW